ncbi:phosphonate C-P lyase system protein PhnG [Actinopolymorpha pittospori]|uniref:Alpha-D-ribose 1-methylphosphonate 5-triphosphate synthase subunit PhnG n=1 Tax=Actinopolymorpha pittospori TaxID=648752 RepID=A0A927N1J4_9ACTN|nr:phosphonate C-P lyase system protein PhnG [Actinopolymorpha pittospori]MBE1606985.1 alpha-D-ribose 1-methylphosphonate 5-triphosphate synthase subunit PhnG [Actinopolymorpha pittospori]
MTSQLTQPSPRARLSSELNQADPRAVIDLAAACLIDDPDVTVTRPPTVGVVVTQVRDTVAEERFILGDVLVTQAEVQRRGTFGWSMRLGSDRVAALAGAILAAEWQAGGPRATEIEALADRTEDRRRVERAAEWERLTPSIVEFEEIP